MCQKYLNIHFKMIYYDSIMRGIMEQKIADINKSVFSLCKNDDELKQILYDLGFNQTRYAKYSGKIYDTKKRCKNKTYPFDKNSVYFRRERI